MDVHFICKKKNSCVGFVTNEKGEIVDKINAVGGKYSTSDKRKLKKLLGTQWGSRNFTLAEGQNMKLISEYLQTATKGDTEGVVTSEMLASVPFSGYKILSEKLKTKHKFPNVGLIQTELIGQPLSTKVEEALVLAHETLPAKDELIHPEDFEPETEEIEEEEIEEPKEPVKKKTTVKKKKSTGNQKPTSQTTTTTTTTKTTSQAAKKPLKPSI